MDPLSSLHEELKKKLCDYKRLHQTQNEEFEQYLSAQTKQVNDMTAKNFSTFIETSSKIISLYDTDKDSPQFFFQYPLDNIFAEEEKFTSALAEYTRKQFFQGISDIAETQDTSQYGLLDLNNPDTQILKGESEAIKMQHRNELLRLQSQYVQCEKKRLQSEVNLHGVKKALETAEEQLKMLTSDSFNIDEIDFDKEIESLTAELKSKKASCDSFFNNEIKTVLCELERLYSTKIIDGNCDLKIARQKYFLEKLDEVIKQLTLQSSRQHSLCLMYKAELKEHRNTYYLLASAKTLLVNEIKSMESRISLLNEPYLNDPLCTNETILSDDKFANRLYDAIVPPSDKVALYKTYQEIADHAKQACLPKEESYDELDAQLQHLKETLKKLEDFLANNYLKEEEQISTLMNNIEDDLSRSELQVNEIIKDIVYKRKILSMDSFKSMERALFPYFFNNPTLLKRCLNEVRSQHVSAVDLSENILK